MPRFVILHHTMPAKSNRPSHWDFMLEEGDILRTWALPDEPSRVVNQLATRLPDHRLDYLTYEGPVSNGRGRVAQWDTGLYHTLEETSAGRCVALAGNRLQTTVRLEQLFDDRSRDAQRWRVVFGSVLPS